MVQLSSVNAGVANDVNNDGFMDLVLGGNDFDLVPQFGRLDANMCTVLLNNGHGKFENVETRFAGISESAEIKDIKKIIVNKRECLLILQNNEYPVLYELGNRSKLNNLFK